MVWRNVSVQMDTLGYLVRRVTLVTTEMILICHQDHLVPASLALVMITMRAAQKMVERLCVFARLGGLYSSVMHKVH